MTTQLYHNLKKLLKVVKHNVNETKRELKPIFIKNQVVSENHNLKLWNSLDDISKQLVIHWWEQEWNETIYEKHNTYRLITTEEFIKFFTLEEYSL